LIVIDASALVAIGRPEADRRIFEVALQEAGGAYLSAINYVETAIVLVRHGTVTTTEELDAWLGELSVEVKEDVGLGQLAAATYLRFGKGFHPARLNLADCFAYALAKQLDAPLLYKGDDFAMTDIRFAL
jgi:ribonuclease VapC